MISIIQRYFIIIAVSLLITSCSVLRSKLTSTISAIPSAASNPTSEPTLTPTLTPLPTLIPTPTSIPYGGGAPLVAYIGGNGEGIELIIGDVFNNQIYYSIPLNRKYLVSEGDYPQALWYGTMPLSWSPDGIQLLLVDQCGEGEDVATLSLCSYNIASNQITEIIPLSENMTRIRDLSWSPDMNWITYQTDENKQTIVNLIDVSDGSKTLFFNAGAPRWDQNSQYMFFNRHGNYSNWTKVDVKTGTRTDLILRCASRDYGEDRESWGCVNYAPEIDAAVVHQENKTGGGYLILIDSEGHEQLVCICNDNFRYNELLFSPNSNYALVSMAAKSSRLRQGVGVFDSSGNQIANIPDNLFAAVAWAPDSNSYLVYRDDDSLIDKPLLLIDRATGEIQYEYHFPTSSWGIQNTDKDYPSLNVYWPKNNSRSREMHQLVIQRSHEQQAASNHGLFSGFAEWIPQLQAWQFQCRAVKKNTSINRVLVKDALIVKTTISSCEYEDANGVMQTIELAIGIDLPQSPHTTEPKMFASGSRFPNEFKYYLNHIGEEGLPFDITVIFGMPNRANIRYYDALDLPFHNTFRTPHADWLADIYSFELLQEFARTGDPDILDGMLVPIMTLGVKHSRQCMERFGCINQIP